MFRTTKYIVALGGITAGSLTLKLPKMEEYEFNSHFSSFISAFKQPKTYTLSSIFGSSSTNKNTSNEDVSGQSSNKGNILERRKAVGWIIIQKDKKLEDKPLSYTISQLKNNFESKGFEMKVVNSANIDIYLTNYDRKSILVDDVITPKPDFVLSRTGANTSFFTLAVYRHLERLGVPVINDSNSIEAAKDKLYSLQILAQNDIPVPQTILLTFPVNVKYVVKRLGLPIIIKCLSGMQGKGVFMAKTEEELQTYCDLLETIQPKNTAFIFQECMKHSLGKDIRVLVINGKVVGGMLRDNTDSTDFRANIHRGAKGTSFKLPRRAENIALQAAKVLSLDIAGVDLLFDDSKGKKFRVCEVNSSPGIEGFENATKINVSKYFLSMVRHKCGIDPYNNDDDDDEDDDNK